MVKGDKKRNRFGSFHAFTILILIFGLDSFRKRFRATEKIDVQSILDRPLESFKTELELLQKENNIQNIVKVDIPLQKTTTVVIGYAISITKCQPGGDRLDQAAVLLYSIHRNSIRYTKETKYDYKAYAFVHPEACNCTKQLENIGYQVLIKELPVLKAEIQGTLKEFIHEASCCGEKEYLKLYSYSLTDHPVVVHFDVDALVLKPLDDLFDTMIEGPYSSARKRVPRQWMDKEMPETIEAFFTRDYNLVDPPDRLPHQIGVQGGFLVIKPKQELLDQYRAIIIDGNYTRFNGWGGKLQYGGYYGAAQIQGLCAYFFGHIRPGTGVELNRCYYNFMGDNPRCQERNNTCRTLEDECQDCRKVNFDEVKTVHFTLCTKPWWCLGNVENEEQRKRYLGGLEVFDLCSQAHLQWFRTRFQLEQAWSERDPFYTMTSHTNLSNGLAAGFCRGRKYLPMKFPKEHTGF